MLVPSQHSGQEGTRRRRVGVWMAGSEALSGNDLRCLVLGLARPLRPRTPERRQLGIQPLPPSPLPSSYCQSAHCRYARAESCLGQSRRENIIINEIICVPGTVSVFNKFHLLLPLSSPTPQLLCLWIVSSLRMELYLIFVCLVANSGPGTQ